jgi:hypothetical protein
LPRRELDLYPGLAQEHLGVGDSLRKDQIAETRREELGAQGTHRNED